MEFKPDRNLVEVAFAAFWKPTLGEGARRILLILGQVVELPAIAVELHVVRVQIGDLHLLADPGADRIAKPRVFLAPVTRSAEHPVGRAEQGFIVET